MTPRAVRGIGPGVGDVDHQHQIGPDRAAALRDDLDDRVVALLQAVVAVGSVHADLQLRGPKSQRLRLRRPSRPAIRAYSSSVRPVGKSEA